MTLRLNLVRRCFLAIFIAALFRQVEVFVDAANVTSCIPANRPLSLVPSAALVPGLRDMSQFGGAAISLFVGTIRKIWSRPSSRSEAALGWVFSSYERSHPLGPD